MAAAPVEELEAPERESQAMVERRWIHEEGSPPDIRGVLDGAARARMNAEMCSRLAHRLGPLLDPASVSEASARAASVKSDPE